MNARKLTALATALMLLSGMAMQSATAQTAAQLANLAPGTVLEGSVESSTDWIVLPASLPGSLQARACGSCAPQVLALGSTTRFNLGGQQVSLQQMAQYCSATAGKPLTVHYRLSDSVVSLVSVLER